MKIDFCSVCNRIHEPKCPGAKATSVDVRVQVAPGSEATPERIEKVRAQVEQLVARPQVIVHVPGGEDAERAAEEARSTRRVRTMNLRADVARLALEGRYADARAKLQELEELDT